MNVSAEVLAVLQKAVDFSIEQKYAYVTPIRTNTNAITDIINVFLDFLSIKIITILYSDYLIFIVY